jgi:hypothetical protein
MTIAPSIKKAPPIGVALRFRSMTDSIARSYPTDPEDG